jgi:hypothetical protein
MRRLVSDQQIRLDLMYLLGRAQRVIGSLLDCSGIVRKYVRTALVRSSVDEVVPAGGLGTSNGVSTASDIGVMAQNGCRSSMPMVANTAIIAMRADTPLGSHRTLYRDRHDLVPHFLIV